MKPRAVLGTAALVMIAIAACVGDDPAVGSSSGELPDSGTNGPDGSSSGSSGTSGSSGSSGDTCTPSCKNADVLLDCAGREQPCALGCAAEAKACRSFDPIGPLTAADLAAHVGEADINLPTTPEPTIVNTTNGAMTHIGGPIRAANGDPSKREIVAGITFERRGGVGIFHARNWTLRNVLVQGDLPVAFVATTEVKVLGHVTTACGQAGGAAGTVAAPGNGGNAQSEGAGGCSGAAGGGHGTAGGAGASAIGDDDAILAGGPAGPAFTFDATNLRGGGRGGGAGNGGGNGGGVIILAAGGSAKIGDGLTVSYKPPTSFAVTVRKGINVGGCGGAGGRLPPPSVAQTGGSGGGAGGLIVVEAPIVLIDANSGLGTNGGGGGGTNSAGADAKIDEAPALAGEFFLGGCTTGANGGIGAAGASAAEPGKPNTPSCGEYTYAGGGGGGGGRILIRNKVGNVNDRAPSSVLTPAAGLDVKAITAH
jgi:hypothetical protein